MVLDTINNKSNIEMSQISIDRSHKLGKWKGPAQKPQTLIVKFTRHKDRHLIFKNKKLLKGNSTFVTESLTLKSMGHLKKAREQHAFANVWTPDGEIIFKRNDCNPKVLSDFCEAYNVRGKTSQLSLAFIMFRVWLLGISRLIFKFYFFIFSHNLSHWRSIFNFYKIQNCLILSFSITNVSLIKTPYTSLFLIFAKTQ